MTEGAVLIDGHDVRKITQHSLRQNIGIVQQEVFLFADSVLENIRYGRPDATDEEVVWLPAKQRSMRTFWPCPMDMKPM